MSAARDAMAGAPRIWDGYSSVVHRGTNKGRTHPHGLDRIVRILHGLARIPLDLVREQELVEHMDAVLLYAEGGHHLGRDGGRVRVGGLDGCHCCRVLVKEMVSILGRV
jgi:hypothetical protein